MKIGDLVRIREWCKDSGKVAIVSGIAPWGGQEIKIQIINQGYKEIWAREANLELVKDVDAISKR